MTYSHLSRYSVTVCEILTGENGKYIFCTYEVNEVVTVGTGVCIVQSQNVLQQ